MRKMSFWSLLVAVSTVFYAKVLADFGSCTYESDLCSCKIGIANEGICWDPIPTEPGLCSKRSCNAGWTCACGGRTHICHRLSQTVTMLSNPDDVSLSKADCQATPFPLVSSTDIVLGTFKIHLSREGILNNDCTQIAWWHNGEALGNRPVEPDMSEANVDEHKKAREEHSLLELRPGDVLAFRIREGSYYCYNHLSEMTVNGTAITTEMAAVETWYARKHSQDWYKKSLQLTAANTGTDESEQDLEKFLPLRKRKIVNDQTIFAGVDYWEPRDDSNADNKRSNWYYRIHIASEPTAQTTAGNEQ